MQKIFSLYKPIYENNYCLTILMSYMRTINISICIVIIANLNVFLNPSFLTAQEIQQPDTEIYERAVQLFDEGLYLKSAQELKRFIETYPEHQLRPSAAFYRARALGKADSTSMNAYYEQFINKYPRHDFSQKLFLELAQNAEKQEKYDKAITYYKRSLDHRPDKKDAPRLNYWIAENYIASGNNERARERFLHLADRHPDSEWAPKALYARGRLYLSENKYDSSSVAFEILKNRYPNDEMTRRIGTALGESYYQQGEYRQAIDAFKNAMPYLDGDLNSKAVFLIAESYNYLNGFDQASTYYKQYINIKKGTEDERKAHYGLGWIYHKQKIYHWASDAFSQAAEGEDELARKALYYKAVNEKLGGRYPEALETFRTFGEQYKQGMWIEEAYYEWAVTAFEMGGYAETIEVLLPLVRGDDNLDWTGKIYTLLGEAYFANKEYTRAIQAFEAAEEVTDISPALKRQARFQKAWVQYRNQAYEQAQPIFETVNREAPNSEIGKEALFWSADAYYSMQHYGPASGQFEKFIQNYPEHKLAGAAHYALGWSYFKMANYEKAISPLKTFLEKYEPPPIELYPYDTDTKLRLGDAYYASGDYPNAIAVYEQAIGAEPGGDYAMFQIANSHYRAENTFEAVTTFRKFLRIYPYSRLREQAQYNIAYIYLNAGNYTQAVKEFQTVINKYPNTSWAARSQYNIGDAYYNAGEFDRAVEEYRKVMQQYPQSNYIIEAVNGIQYAQLSADKPDSSSAILEEFLNNHPQTGTADQLRYRQASNLMQSGDYENAIKELRHYIRISNNQKLIPEAHFNLGNAYEQTGQTDKAVEAYRLIINNFPDSEQTATALTALGRISYQRENYKQSVTYYENLLQKDQDFRMEALIGMGKAYLGMENYSEARKQFENALNTNSSHDPARVGLARVELQNRNYLKAEDLLGFVAESNTTEIGAEAQYLLGVSKQEQDEFKEALNAYSNVKVLYEAYDNWVAKALLNSAECYIQIGSPADARNQLNTIIDQYPGTEEARQAQKLLESN